MHFSVEFHHMGSFVNDPIPHYEGGQVHVVHNLDLDKWSYPEALGIVKNKFGYFENIKLWWKTKESGFEDGLKLITEDTHTLELAKYALKNKCEVEVYVEHAVSLPEVVEEVPCNEEEGNVGGGDNNNNNNNKEDVCDVVEDEDVEMGDGGAEDVHLDDSEERAVAAGDGFDNPIHGNKCEKVSRKRKSVPATRPIGLRRKLPERKARKNRIGGKSGNDGKNQEPVEHHTEELDRGEFDSKSDKASKPIYTKFNMEDMSKDFEFKVGMEFSSLKEFKEAIIEHSILNGREIKFQKNDAIRVRVGCKHACNFVAFVSKDGYGNTFRMKTLEPKHTCEKVFNNKIAKSKWVAKVVADKFLSNEKMKVNDIVDEIRSSYALEITPSRARKARQIAKEMWTVSLSTADPAEDTSRQKKVTAKEKPSTSQKRGEGKVTATSARKTQRSHVNTVLQEGPIGEGAIAHTEVVENVQPLRYYKHDESDGPIDVALEPTFGTDGSA